MFDKDSRERKMFADFYKLCEKFWKVPDKDEAYYDELVKESDEFRKKYETGDGFATSLHDALVDRVSKLWRESYGGK